MVILDASGSMNTADAPGPRITAAKQAVTHLVRGLPASARVGLEVYGTSTSSAPSAKAAGCQDIKIEVPVGHVNKAAFIAKVRTIRASGYTPIGAALRKAAAALPSGGPGAIVLVSDGIDTCAPPNPCTVAKQLKQSGVDLTVDTVGFRVDGAARRQLSCIAAVTGGSYSDANDGSALDRELHAGVGKAMQPYTVEGTPISGSPGRKGAPLLKPGQYVDVYDRAPRGVFGDGTVKYYSIDVGQGETSYISATMVPAPLTTPGSTADTDNFGVSAELYAPDGTRCGYDLADNAPVEGDITAQTALLSVHPGGTTGCPDQGRYILRLARQGQADPSLPLKLELALRVEPPATTAGLPGPAHEAGMLRIGEKGRIRSVPGGDSFNDAPVIKPGRYGDTMVSGDTRFYRVHLAWGQRLAFTITPTKGTHRGRTDASVIDPTCYTRIYNPVREWLNVSSGFGTMNSDVNSGFSSSCGQDRDPLDGARTASAAMIYPARYTNRRDTDYSIGGYGLDGDYYLAVNLSYESDQPVWTIPYVLSVKVVGKPERGPVYQSPPPTQSTSATPTTSSVPDSPSTSAPSPSAPASPAASDPSSSRSGPAVAFGRDGGGSSSAGPIVGSVIGVVVVLALGIGLALRRRSQRPRWR